MVDCISVFLTKYNVIRYVTYVIMSLHKKKRSFSKALLSLFSVVRAPETDVHSAVQACHRYRDPETTVTRLSNVDTHLIECRGCTFRLAETCSYVPLYQEIRPSKKNH